MQMFQFRFILPGRKMTFINLILRWGAEFPGSGSYAPQNDDHPNLLLFLCVLGSRFVSGRPRQGISFLWWSFWLRRYKVNIFYGDARSFVGDFPTKCGAPCLFLGFMRALLYPTVISHIDDDRRFILIKKPPSTRCVCPEGKPNSDTLSIVLWRSSIVFVWSLRGDLF